MSTNIHASTVDFKLVVHKQVQNASNSCKTLIGVHEMYGRMQWPTNTIAVHFLATDCIVTTNYITLPSVHGQQNSYSHHAGL